MNIEVKLFAAAAQSVGSHETKLDVQQGATLADVRDALLEQQPQLAELLTFSRWAIDHRFATESEVIERTCEIALIPPVSGG